MGHRLTKIYTRTGDSGTTLCGDGLRVSKSSMKIEAYGTLDELNSHIGVVLSGKVPVTIRDVLEEVQHVLFDLGGELFKPGCSKLSDSHVNLLESHVDQINQGLAPLKEFILPGGGIEAAFCHVARTVCRRCERVVVAVSEQSEINPLFIKYLNRLSDLLFVIARVLARQDGGSEVYWDPGRCNSSPS